MIWFGWLLWNIKYYRLFNAKSSSYILLVNAYFVENILNQARTHLFANSKMVMYWFVRRLFIDNLIFKCVRTELFAHS